MKLIIVRPYLMYSVIGSCVMGLYGVYFGCELARGSSFITFYCFSFRGRK